MPPIPQPTSVSYSHLHSICYYLSVCLYGRSSTGVKMSPFHSSLLYCPLCSLFSVPSSSFSFTHCDLYLSPPCYPSSAALACVFCCLLFPSSLLRWSSFFPVFVPIPGSDSAVDGEVGLLGLASSSPFLCDLNHSGHPHHPSILILPSSICLYLSPRPTTTYCIKHTLTNIETQTPFRFSTGIVAQHPHIFVTESASSTHPILACMVDPSSYTGLHIYY
ncbi:hypothetical protein FKP32DRAFT_1417910 [Trametes sanguinea]|nr:hypothetical protein FKP32DRAFT_1417910 [Trametes sanguinea]